MSTITSLMLLSAAGLAAAQTTVSSLFLIGFEGKNLQASVVAVTAKPPSAQFFVRCAPGTDGSDCGLGPGVSVTMAPGSYALGLNDAPAFTMSQICQIEQQTAVCTMIAAGPEANDPGTQTSTLKGSETDNFFMPVTITAGMERFAAATAGGGSGSDSGSGASKPTPGASSGAGTPSTAGAALSSPTSGTGGGTSTSTHTAGAAVPQITQYAMLAGAAALVGGAMIL